MTDLGYSVKNIQRALNERNYKLAVDGVMGTKTVRAIEDFQKKHGLYADGIVGPLTAKVLFAEPEGFKDVKKRLKFVRVSCDKYGKGADVTYLREDAAQSFEKVAQELRAVGALVTSSGGRRLLSASVGRNRSQTSLHYLGIAHDLFVWSGMVDPHKDPYVVEKVGERSWRVWARCTKDCGPGTVKAYTYDHKEVTVTGNFVDLTHIMEKHGWHGIRARRSFFSRKNKMGAEWWHFQYEAALKPGARFGDELLKSYKLDKLRTYSLWNHRMVQWKESWF